jgi:hypothetical protein
MAQLQRSWHLSHTERSSHQRDRNLSWQDIFLAAKAGSDLASDHPKELHNHTGTSQDKRSSNQAFSLKTIKHPYPARRQGSANCISKVDYQEAAGLQPDQQLYYGCNAVCRSGAVRIERVSGGATFTKPRLSCLPL